MELLKYKIYKNIKNTYILKTVKVVDGITIGWMIRKDVDLGKLYLNKCFDK